MCGTGPAIVFLPACPCFASKREPPRCSVSAAMNAGVSVYKRACPGSFPYTSHTLRLGKPRYRASRTPHSPPPQTQQPCHRVITPRPSCHPSCSNQVAPSKLLNVPGTVYRAQVPARRASGGPSVTDLAQTERLWAWPLPHVDLSALVPYEVRSWRQQAGVSTWQWLSVAGRRGRIAVAVGSKQAWADSGGCGWLAGVGR